MPELLRQQVAAATAAGLPLRIRGGGSKDFYGQSLEGDVLDTRACQGIVAYEPAELVLSARCGTPLRDIEALLARHGQMLGFEPPHFGPDATLGGCIATGLSGPRRATAGAVRDFVLGVKLMDGKGQILAFGGQVMKNVAGYDVSRALAGSLGILGLILETSIKVLPVPAASATLVFDCDQQQALTHMNTWAAAPLPISASAWHAGQLRVRLAGAHAAVKAARQKLGGQLIDAETANSWWADLREQRLAFFAGDSALWRLSVPSMSAALDLPGEQLIEWGGALRWWKTAADATTVRACATAGHATLFRADATTRAQTQVFTPLAPTLMQIHRALKAKFDPAGIFNRGRMYPDL